jgi:hypothetical protein
VTFGLGNHCSIRLSYGTTPRETSILESRILKVKARLNVTILDGQRRKRFSDPNGTVILWYRGLF